jgi:hypothetical protein
MAIRQYDIISHWGPRPESTTAIAERLLQMTAALGAIDPVFQRWFFEGEPEDSADTPEEMIVDRSGAKLLEAVRERLPDLIAASCHERTRDGQPWAQFGYMFHVLNSQAVPNPRRIAILIRAGTSTLDAPYNNGVWLNTANQVSEVTDPAIVTYDIFRAVVLAIAQAWDVTWCSAFPTDLTRVWSRSQSFNPGWISYVSPRFVPLLMPPPSLEVQQLPGGGALMVATRERFDVTNAAHLEAAEDVDIALMRINKLRWPPDARPWP